MAQRLEEDRSGGRLAVRAAYEVWAEAYDEEDPTTRLDEPAVVSLCWPVAGRHALDLGCGTGRYARLLAARGAHVLGVDLSHATLRRARARATVAGRACFLQASVELLPLPSGAFERVVCGLVADHLPDLRPLLRETARVLLPGGRAVMTLLHPELQRATGPAVRFSVGGRVYRTRGFIHEPPAVEAAAEASGLRLCARLEPRIDRAIAMDRPSWTSRLGLRAFLIYAWERP